MDPEPADSVGLCARCRNSRIVRGRRSQFWFCELSRTDARFPKYPRLPMVVCLGFAPATAKPTDPEQEPEG